MYDNSQQWYTGLAVTHRLAFLVVLPPPPSQLVPSPRFVRARCQQNILIRDVRISM